MIGPGTSTHTALPWPRDDNAACPERGAGKCSPPEEKCPPALLLGGWAAICNLKDAACHSERRKSLASLSCPKLGLFLITLSKALQLKPLLVGYLITSSLKDFPKTITTALCPPQTWCAAGGPISTEQAHSGAQMGPPSIYLRGASILWASSQ